MKNISNKWNLSGSASDIGVKFIKDQCQTLTVVSKLRNLEVGQSWRKDL